MKQVGNPRTIIPSRASFTKALAASLTRNSLHPQAAKQSALFSRFHTADSTWLLRQICTLMPSLAALRSAEQGFIRTGTNLNRSLSLPLVFLLLLLYARICTTIRLDSLSAVGNPTCNSNATDGRMLRAFRCHPFFDAKHVHCQHQLYTTADRLGFPK